MVDIILLTPRKFSIHLKMNRSDDVTRSKRRAFLNTKLNLNFNLKRIQDLFASVAIINIYYLHIIQKILSRNTVNEEKNRRDDKKDDTFKGNRSKTRTEKINNIKKRPHNHSCSDHVLRVSSSA